MFRNRDNIIKKVAKRIIPDRYKIRKLTKNIFEYSFQEQKKQNIHSNQDKYSEDKYKKTQNIKPKNKPKNKPESYYRDKLARELKGKTEVQTSAGRIDILTKNEIIEVKNIRKWKEAIGQIIAYGKYYPYHQKRIHLFGINSENRNKINIIEKHCLDNEIILTWE